MKVLVACECSGRVREAFRKRGHDAWSCDILPSEDNSPFHRQENILGGILDEGWDLMVAHPPCTYLSRAGARWLYAGGKINDERLAMGMEARKFLLSLLNAPIPKIAVENPTPMRIFNLPTPSQAIQPFEYGHPYSKRTLLWLKNLPNLVPTNVVNEHRPFLPSNTGGAKRGQKHTPGVVSNPTDAARTFDGIAEAMAQQWGVRSIDEALGMISG